MADFLTTKGTAAHIENIIMGASQQLVLISPYLKISDMFFSRLRDANNRAVKITIVYRTNELKDGEYNMLSSLKNIEFRSLMSLHAKCYYNECDMVITSMNMYEYSENNNAEMGIGINKGKDPVIFGKALMECNHIIQSSELISSGKSKTKTTDSLTAVYTKPTSKQSEKGNCIHCGDSIEFNPTRPYCDKCFSTWKRYNNPNYEELFCHSCGDVSDNLCMNTPQCPDCYNNWNRRKGNQRKTG